MVSSLCCFFFKQKTAYEVRISDWSSDVCSSESVVDGRRIEVGMLELDFRHPGQCELSYVGLVPDLAGQGHGRWLMAHALALAWRKGVARVWVHTCTLDHPAALGFYRASGFTPIRRTIETFEIGRAHV